MDGGKRLKCDHNSRSTEQHEGDLLPVDPAGGLAPPPGRSAETSEWIDVHDQQHDGKTHGHRLGEERTREQGNGHPIPPPAVLRPLVGSKVRQDRQQVEESREHIAPFRDPRDGFNPKGMDGEQESGEGGRKAQSWISFRTIRQGQRHEPKDQEVERHRIRGMQQEAGEMVTEGVHAPDPVIQAQGHPRQRNIVTHMKCGPHPAEVCPRESPIVGVAEEVQLIVPDQKLVLQHREERSNSERGDQRRRKPPDPPPGRSAHDRTIDRGTCLRGLDGLTPQTS